MGVPQQSLTVADGQHYKVHVDIISALSALADCASQLESEPLKGALCSAAGNLVGHIERCCRELVDFLLGGCSHGGGSGSDSDIVAYDKLWTLRAMSKRSEVTRRWIQDAGGMAAVSRVMALHAAAERVQKEGTWLVYVLCGIDGIAELLRQNRSNPAVQEAAAWAIYELAGKQKDSGKAGTTEWTQAEDLIVLFTEAMRARQSPSADFLWACLSALRELVQAQPCRGSLFIESGGDQALLKALTVGRAAGDAGSTLLVSSMQLIASIVDGNASVAQRLRVSGALDNLVACGFTLPGKVADETMWTLGQIGGVMAVLQVIAQTPNSPEAVRSGLRAAAKLTWLPLDDSLTQQFPQAAEVLLGLARNMSNRPNEDIVYTLQALGGCLHFLTPHAAPGQWSVADSAVNILINAVGPNNDELVAQAAVASLGHIASSAPAWRQPLQAVLPDLAQRMRVPGTREESMKHQKCLFWASAVIAGLPVVLNEMRSQANSPHIQDAAISAIVDILDKDIDSPGSFGSKGSDSGIEPAEIRKAIETVAGAMRLHRTHVPVQWSGCHALGLLHTALGVGEDVPTEAFTGVLSSIRWHPEEYKVASGACNALRAFLEPRRGRECAASNAVVAKTVSVLRAQDIVRVLRKLLDDFSMTNDVTLLEDALYTLGLTDGVGIVLQVLAGSQSNHVKLRSAGLKALFELGRTFPDLMKGPPQPSEIRAIVNAIAAEASAAAAAAGPGGASSENVELLRRAELVNGMVCTL